MYPFSASQKKDGARGSFPGNVAGSRLSFVAKKYFLFMAAGFVAMAAQVVFIRELLVVFSGDELAIGTMLCAWMLSGALGSLAFYRFFQDADRTVLENNLPLALAGAGLYLPCGVMLASLCRGWFGLQPGELFPPIPLLFSSFILVAPFCACLGFIFAAACRINRGEGGAAGVYMYESLGAVAGGLFATFFLVPRLSGLESAAMIAGLACFLSAICVARKKARLGVILALCAIVGASVFTGVWKRAHVFFLQRRWPGYSITFTGESVYGPLAVIERGTQVSVFQNGSLLASFPDRQRSEEAVHLCLLQHEAPRRVLLIGGGRAGLLGEILKHDVESVDYVELDPLLAPKTEDSRVRTYFGDGRAFVNSTVGRYDCIIVHSGDPSTALGNRYFTRNFFERIRSIMNDRGIFSFGLPASESFLTAENRRLLISVRRALSEVFTRTLAVPGETCLFFAGPAGSRLTADYRLLMERASARGLDLAYVREYYLFSRMSPEKLSWFEGEMAKEKDIEANSDFRPSAYYHMMQSSLARSRDIFLAKAFGLLREYPLAMVLVLALGVLSPAFLPLSTGKGVLLASVSVMGFSSMSAQMVILFLFQMFYGYLYYQVGLFFTLFMAGIVSGTSCAARCAAGSGARALCRLLICVVFFYALLPAVFTGLSPASGELMRRLGSFLVFTGLSFVTGLLAGAQFGLSAHIWPTGRSAEEGGLLYASDLAGACMGVFFTSVFIIPVLGVFHTLMFVAALNAACFLLLRGRSKKGQVSKPVEGSLD